MSKRPPTPSERNEIMRKNLKTLETLKFKGEFPFKAMVAAIVQPNQGQVIHMARELLKAKRKEISYTPSFRRFLSLKLKGKKFKLVLQNQGS